ncbi:HNH endonuclease [Curtobacterium sp. 'Ferrero']|uniref:HNH endonuclease n=1 Tax=Curtobacterium sp. 'Ferrero' TaxID=2033654 RepID=UPI001596E4E5|nr:HNH endonuclease [Curtobacterium sp. 'Ferrero']
MSKQHKPVPPCSIATCDAPARNASAAYCNRHDKRIRKHGNADVVAFARADDATPLADRLRLHADIGGPDDCWEWQGARNADGYGVTKTELGNLAHRVSYQVWVGPIPDGYFACHTCDNPPCINPRHLFTGSPADNVHDMIRKGRNRRRAA